MIKRFVRQSGMAIVHRRPGDRVVAERAVPVRVEVSRTLACRRDAVMAGSAAAQHLGVIY